MDNSLFYPILINSAVTLSGILLTYYFTKRRYSYEKLFDKKLISLEEIYSQVISLEKDIKKYIWLVGADLNADLLSRKREEIFLIKSKFFKLQDYFWEKEIILDENSVNVVQSFIDLSNEVIAKLNASIISQELKDYKTFHKQWEDSYLLMENELTKVKKQLKDDFKKTIKSRS